MRCFCSGISFRHLKIGNAFCSDLAWDALGHTGNLIAFFCQSCSARAHNQTSKCGKERASGNRKLYFPSHPMAPSKSLKNDINNWLPIPHPCCHSMCGLGMIKWCFAYYTTNICQYTIYNLFIQDTMEDAQKNFMQNLSIITMPPINSISG